MEGDIKLRGSETICSRAYEAKVSRCQHYEAESCTPTLGVSNFQLQR